MNEAALENVYSENLEERIISCLAEKKNLSLDEAMDVYYRSRLAKKIQQGVEGIQYLDYKVLGQMILECFDA